MSDTNNRWKLFGAWVKEKRENARFSQEGLGDLVDLDRQQIYRIENGYSGTKRENVKRIAEALGANIDEAYRMAGFASQEMEVDTWDSDIKIACLGAENMTKEERERILMAVKSFVAGVRAERQERERNARGKQK